MGEPAPGSASVSPHRERAMTQTWNLYLDESGPLHDPNQVVVLAGALLPAASSPSKRRRERPLAPHEQLQVNLRAAAPSMPWPLRAHLLHVDPLWLWCEERDLPPAPRQALAALRQRDPALDDALRRALDAGQEPSPADLVRLRRLGRQTPWAQVVSDYAGRRRAQLRAASHGQGGHVILASEWPLPQAATARGRDAQLMLALLERLQDGLERLPGDHLVHVYAAWRHVEDDVFDRASLAQLIQRIEAPRSPRVRWSVMPVHHLAQDQGPTGLLLADHVAHQARRLLRLRPWVSVIDLEHLAQDHGLSASVPAPSARAWALPWPCAAGQARDALNARRGQPQQPPPALSGAPPWVMAQALAWAPHL